MRSILMSVALALCGWSSAFAEYPALETALASHLNEPAQLIGQDTVRVAVRNLTGLTPPWKVTEAIQTELVAGLKAGKVSALDAGFDNLLQFLGEGIDSFNAKDMERARRAAPDGFLLLGRLQRSGQSPVLVLDLVDAAGKTVWKKELPIDSAALAMDANIPPLNREVLAAAASKFGQTVGNDSSWAFAADVLKQVQAVRPGIYQFGRELGPTEAWVPGDVLQFVGVRFKEEKGKRYSNLGRHTAIVEKVNSPTEIEVLHQGFNDQPVSRRKLRFDEFQKGYIVAFRPTKDESAAGDRPARRLRMPEPDVQKDGSVNLLPMIDPQLDSVRGIWHRSDGPLEPFKENMAVLQIPYDLPESYTLSLRIKRVSGTNTFGLGLKVGDRHGFLVMDAYDGVTGFHRLSGKRANQNASTKKGTVLPQNQVVELICQVTPKSVSLKADGKPVLDWKGNPKDLTVDDKWKTPEKLWLFLATNESVFEITRIKLTTP